MSLTSVLVLINTLVYVSPEVLVSASSVMSFYATVLNFTKGSDAVDVGPFVHEQDQQQQMDQLLFDTDLDFDRVNPSKTLIRLHGIFMVIAWIGTTTIGILIARFFKRTWVESQKFGADEWFFWHRVCMMFTWCLTLTAFIMIFIDVEGWSQDEIPHAILGIITTAICFLHPILAMFRPNVTSEKRKYFNWAHAWFGNLAHSLAIATIFLSISVKKATLPPWLYWVLTAFTISYIFANIYFSIILYKSQKHSLYGNRNIDAPFSKYRKWGLFLYCMIVAGFVAAIVTTIIIYVNEDEEELLTA